jgi:LPXTG-motif cell wall-anchored protein
MKHYFFLLSLTLLTIATFAFSIEVEAVNYDTEIGLTFTNDIEGSQESSTIESSDKAPKQPNQPKQFPKTKSNEVNETRNRSFLPKTGSITNDLFIWIGALVLAISFVWLLKKGYYRLKK